MRGQHLVLGKIYSVIGFNLFRIVTFAVEFYMREECIVQLYLGGLQRRVLIYANESKCSKERPLNGDGYTGTTM